MGIQLRVKKEKKRNIKEKKSEVKGEGVDLEQKSDEKAGDGKIEKISEIPQARTNGSKNNQEPVVDQSGMKKGVRHSDLKLAPDSEPVKHGHQPASTSMSINLLENEQFQYNSNSDIIQNVENNS